MVMTALAQPSISVTPYGPGTGANNRAMIMRRAYMYYVGQPPLPLRKPQGSVDDNVVVALGRTIVDKGVSFLFGQEVTSTISTPGQEAAQDWLDECWRRNKRMLTLQKLATFGGICGHVFAKIVPEGIKTQPGSPDWPRVVPIDPQLVSVVTEEDDCDQIIQYIIDVPPPGGMDAAEPDDVQGDRRQLITRGHDGYSWTITDQHFTGGAWYTDVVTPWDWPFSPIVDCQNLPRPGDTWGESDLPEDIQNILKAINRVASCHNKIIRLFAAPKVWARGMGTRTIDTAIDAVIQMPSETAELKTLEMHSDLSSTREFMNALLQALAMCTRIPLVALGQPDNMGSPSGVALQIRYQPLLEKTEQKRLTYGDLIQELDRRLLALGGKGDAHLTQQNWHEMLPTDPLMERQVMVLDDSLGVRSKKSIAEALDLDYDSEMEQMQTEADLAAQKAQATGLPLTQTAPGQPQPATGAPLAPGQSVPPPAALQAPNPDIAKTARSR